MTEDELRIRKRLVEIDSTIMAVMSGRESLYLWLVHEPRIRKPWIAELRAERERLVLNVPEAPLSLPSASVSGG